MSDQIQLPDLETLFGGQVSFCKCEECGSLYSPAAYLVDVLHSILETRINALDAKGNPIKDQGNPVNGTYILQQRRPDIENIELSCQNTNTRLPYVDLVNEILENAIAPVNVFPQTVGTADELAASPEHVNLTAYDPNNPNTPAGAVYPWGLPFNPYLEAVRTYLQRLGSSHYEVMQVFQKNGDPADFKQGTPTGLALACEYLNLSPEEHGILTGTDLTGQPLGSPRELPEFYGFPKGTATDALINGLQPGYDPNKPNTPAGASVFLQKTGLDFSDLIDLLKTNFLNPNQTIVPDTPSDKDPCDLSQTTLKGLDEATLKKLHRFVRLWKKLGWQIGELDKAIQVLGAADIDDAFLVKLAQVKQVHDQLKLPLVQMFSFWANIDTRADNSLYNRLFQNKAVLNPADSAFALKEPDRSELADTGQTISAHVNTILAALQITASDLDAIRPAAKLADEPNKPPVPLNLANLSSLYRHALLAKALRLSIKDFIVLKTLGCVDPFPFQANTPSPTLTFLETVNKIRQSAFSVAILNYLYLSFPSPGISPLEENVKILLSKLQDGLNKIAIDSAKVSDPNGDVLRQTLPNVVDPNQVDATMSLLAGTAVYTAPLASPPNIVFPDPVNTKISYDPTAKQLTFTGAMTDDEKKQLVVLSKVQSYTDAINIIFQQPRTFISTSFAGFLDPKDAIAQLIDNPSLTLADRYTYVLSRLMAYLQGQSLITQTLGDSLKLDTALIKLLLGTVLKSVVDPSKSAMADFLVLAGSGPIDPAIPAMKAYHLLYKVALLVKGFKISAKELEYISGHSADFSNFDLNKLPLDPSGFTVALFTQWERLHDLFALRDSLPQGEVGLTDVFAAGSLDDAKKQLVLASGWEASELDAVAGLNGLNLGAKDFKNEINLLPLQASRTLSRRLGVSAKKLFDWAGSEPVAQEAQDIQNAVKAKYDDQTWLTVAKPFQDVLREKRRAALVSFLLGNPNVVDGQTFGNSDDLFDYFLIDAEMSPCQMTSRIKQAISSVQIFVQRCLMKLEWYPFKDAKGVAVSIDPEAVEWWKWMRSYRLWEVNRKVFLYPENWIDVSLLPDKTPFFEALENQLLQGDITNESAEDALHNYLEKLDQVARLEVIGLYHEQAPKDGDDAPDVLHVFGRTWGVPHAYFYRRRVNLSGAPYWTAWEKVDVDIQGEHLIPVVWNRRPHIFWPVFTKKQVDDKRSSPAAPDMSASKTGGSLTDTIYVKLARLYGGVEHAAGEEGSVPVNGPSASVTVKLPSPAPRQSGWKVYFETAASSGSFYIVPTTSSVVIQQAAAGTQANGLVVRSGSPLTDTNQDALVPPEAYWEIQLAWSEYKNGKWKAKQLSSGPPLVTWSAGGVILLEEKDFFFKAVASENLSMDCVFGYNPHGGKYPNDWLWLKGTFEATCNGILVANKLPITDPNAGDFEPIDTPPLLPDSTTLTNMKAIHEAPTKAAASFLIPAETSVGVVPNYDPTTSNWNDVQQETVLKPIIPSAFDLLYPQEDVDEFYSQDPFFYQDDKRTFFVLPESYPVASTWYNSDTVSPPWLTQKPVFQQVLGNSQNRFL